MNVRIPRPAAQKIVDVYVSAQFAKYDLIHKIEDRKARKAQKKYDARIAEMQANIGPYKPATIPVQVWA
jgi:hypothetical protein